MGLRNITAEQADTVHRLSEEVNFQPLVALLTPKNQGVGSNIGERERLGYLEEACGRRELAPVDLNAGFELGGHIWRQHLPRIGKRQRDRRSLLQPLNPVAVDRDILPWLEYQCD